MSHTWPLEFLYPRLVAKSLPSRSHMLVSRSWKVLYLAISSPRNPLCLREVKPSLKLPYPLKVRTFAHKQGVSLIWNLFQRVD
jgi:hypothetical protein